MQLHHTYEIHLVLCNDPHLKKKKSLTCNCESLQRFVVVIQSLSHVQLFATPWIIAHQTFLSSTISLEFAQNHA